MEEKIMGLIQHYSIQGKEFDERFIRELIRYVKEERQLVNYLDGVDVDYETSTVERNIESIDSEDSRLAKYVPVTREIKVYINDMLNYIRSMVDIYKKAFPEIQGVFLTNLIGSRMILHELEHVYQAKKIEEMDTDEARILKVSHPNITIFREYLDQGLTDDEIRAKIVIGKDIYNDMYDIEPGERLANIDSFRTIHKMITGFRKYTPELYGFSRFLVNNNLIDGYCEKDGILAPTVVYLQAKGEYPTLRSFDWYSENFDESVLLSQKKYKLSDRLRLGLPISKAEFIRTKEQINNLTLHR